MGETYYKVLNDDGSCFHGGKGKWPLPVGKKSGAWMPKIKKLELCVSGYHILKREQLVHWLGPAIFKVEVRGDVLWDGDKGVAQEGRLICKLGKWNDRTARLFACDCADAVRHLMKDKRSTDAIDVARRFANGQATKEELNAASDAESAAAWDAARDTARDAAWAAASAAAWAAARAATWAAARDAAGDAARDAAWAAQTKRLFEYLEGKAP